MRIIKNIKKCIKNESFKIEDLSSKDALLRAFSYIENTESMSFENINFMLNCVYNEGKIKEEEHDILKIINEVKKEEFIEETKNNIDYIVFESINMIKELDEKADSKEGKIIVESVLNDLENAEKIDKIIG